MENDKNNPFLAWAVILLGVTSIVAQVILIRELVIVFYGNELSLGTMLGVWLFWTAVGSGLLSRIKIRDTLLSFGTLQLLLALILPCILWIVRAAKNVLSITLGEMIGFTPMLSLTLITLAPLCLINGLLYPIACRQFHNTKKDAAESIGNVYLLESAGATLGGLAASFILYRFIGAFYMLMLLSLFNLLSALWIVRHPQSRKKGLWIFLTGIGLVVYGTVTLGFSGAIQRSTNRLLWRGHKLVHSSHSIYGNIAVTIMGEQMSFYENGLLMATAPDRLTAEESVHFAMLEHPEPRHVLLIGGGTGGAMQEVLKHPSVEKLSYVQLDPVSLRIAQRLLESEHTPFLADPRVTVHHLDGRRFIKNTSLSFDVIILNLPNPYTAQLNRFYTVEFFREVFHRLADDGVFSMQSSSSENAIGPELSDFLSTLRATLNTAFSDIVMIPGETVRIIASKAPSTLTSDPHILIKRLKERNLQTLYVREY